MQINKTSKESIIKSLELLANELMLNNIISINDSLFSVIDLEIYYWHALHPDEYARGIPHRKPYGEFDAHRYGIDFSLGNQLNIEFGGILICGLYDIASAIVIQKSDVKNTLFNRFKMGNNKLELITKKTPWTATFKSKRLNLGKAVEDNHKQFENSYYKFLVKDETIFNGYKGKEAIFRNSDLTDDEIVKILGYKLTR